MAATDFRDDVGLDPGFPCGHVEARRAVDAIDIEQSHGGHAKLSTRRNQFLGQGSAFEKAERGAGVKLYIH